VDSTADWTVILPRNALIASIQIFRPANDGPDEPYELHVGNGDKSVIYGTDGGGIRARAARSITVQFKLADMVSAGESHSGDSHPNNQVRLWASPTTSYRGALGGYFIVQYY
jgi:hypothetical protein